MSEVNSKAKLILVGKELKSGRIAAYYVLGLNGSRRRITRSAFLKLAGENKIANCKLQGQSLVGLGISLRQIGEFDKATGRLMTGLPEAEIYNMVMSKLRDTKLVMTARIYKGRDCVGYILRDSGGNTVEKTKEQTIGLIKQRRIENVSCQNYNGSVLIRGINGFNIEALPIKRLDGKQTVTEQEILKAKAPTAISKRETSKQNIMNIGKSLIAEASKQQKETKAPPVQPSAPPEPTVQPTSPQQQTKKQNNVSLETLLSDIHSIAQETIFKPLENLLGGYEYKWRQLDDDIRFLGSIDDFMVDVDVMSLTSLGNLTVQQLAPIWSTKHLFEVADNFMFELHRASEMQIEKLEKQEFNGTTTSETTKLLRGIIREAMHICIKLVEKVETGIIIKQAAATVVFHLDNFLNAIDKPWPDPDEFCGEAKLILCRAIKNSFSTFVERMKASRSSEFLYQIDGVTDGLDDRLLDGSEKVMRTLYDINALDFDDVNSRVKIGYTYREIYGYFPKTPKIKMKLSEYMYTY